MERGEIAEADHGTASPPFSLLVFVGDKTTTKERERKEDGQKKPRWKDRGGVYGTVVFAGSRGSAGL